ncbi:hypothetical protein [Tepidimonas taiwanensis]|uniref:DUF7305 domain-containing protein n=1 Tax=Tepidimonas taiwanensis TaxID=307486 RepID=UPI00128FC4CB|nr:hypothetical protein [Tepidimonas taiwanensis]
MNSAKLTSLSAKFLILGTLLTAAATVHPQTCGGGPGIFNVFDGGKVAVNTSMTYSDYPGSCATSFTGSTWVNVRSTNLFGPKGHGNDCPLQATDQNVSPLTLPPFPTTANAPNIRIYNWNGPTTGFALTYNGQDRYYTYCTQGNNRFWVYYSDECKQNNAVTSFNAVTFPIAGDATSTFRLTGNDFGAIDITAAPITFTGASDVRIAELRAQNGATINLNGGTNHFVQNLNLQDNYRIKVTGSGTAKLYVDRVTRMNGNGSCININGNCNGNNSSVDLNAQNPERLSIYVYNGDLELWDRTQIAAAIYVHNGDLRLRANSEFSLIGEAVARNIAVTNGYNVRMHYQDTGAFNTILPTAGSRRTGLYSGARPAVPAVAKTGDFAFITYQMDYGGTQKNMGTLRAFPLKADGTTESTPAWDAKATITSQDRASKIFIDVNGTGVAASTLAATHLSTLGIAGGDPTAILNRIRNGPSGSFPDRWDSILGKPNNTQPVIFNDLVLFSTNEGILYALDRMTGSLRWGWMPGDFVRSYTTAAAYEALLAGDDMRGQIGVATVAGVGYVFVTAKGGELHFGLRINASTGLPERVWMDARSGQSSPNAERPIFFNDRVAYIVGNRVVIRPATGGNPETDQQPNLGGATITSSPTIVASPSSTSNNNNNGNNNNNRDPFTLLVGTNTGKVMSAGVSNSGAVGSFTEIGSIGASEAVRYVVYTRTVDAEYVTAQSIARVTTFKRALTGSGGWVRIWTSSRGSAQEWEFPSGTSKSSTPIPALPSTGEITDRVTSIGGFITIPFTLPPPSGACEGEARLYVVALDPAFAYYAPYYRDQRLTAAYITVGSGTAFMAQGFYLDGRMVAQGHSEKNTDNRQGLDDPIEFAPIPPNKGPGRRSWREIILNR